MKRVTRRRVVKAAIAGALLAGTAGLVARVRSQGYVLPAGVTLAGLETWQYLVVRALAARVCAPDASDAPVASGASPEGVDVAGFVDAYVAKMPARMRRDLGRFLGYVEQIAPAATFRTARFTQLGPGEQDRVLAALESSTSDLLRGGFEGVKALLFMGYYRDPRTWKVIGYDGPLVGRPEGGF